MRTFEVSNWYGLNDFRSSSTSDLRLNGPLCSGPERLEPRLVIRPLARCFILFFIFEYGVSQILRCEQRREMTGVRTWILGRVQAPLCGAGRQDVLIRAPVQRNPLQVDLAAAIQPRTDELSNAYAVSTPSICERQQCCSCAAHAVYSICIHIAGACYDAAFSGHLLTSLPVSSKKKKKRLRIAHSTALLCSFLPYEIR